MVKIETIEIESALWVAAFAYFGVAIRILLSQLASISRDSLIGAIGVTYFLPNIFGTFALGLNTGLQPLLSRPWQSVGKGFSTGFCGSLTTFSTWQLAVGLEALDNRWVDAVTKSSLVVATSYSAFVVGIQLGMWITEIFSDDRQKKTLSSQSHVTNVPTPGYDNGGRTTSISEYDNKGRTTPIPEYDNEERTTPIPEYDNGGRTTPIPEYDDGGRTTPIPEYVNEGRTTPIPEYDDEGKTATDQKPEMICASYLYWPVAATTLVTATIWLLFAFDKRWAGFWLAMSFGPFGALLRHLLSFGNRKTPNFPVFTLIANELATIINILIVIAYNFIQPSASDSTMQLFELWARSGLSTGFMGSLSTVSTWISELHRLSNTKSLWYSYRYGLITIVLAQIFVIGSGSAYVVITQKYLLV